VTGPAGEPGTSAVPGAVPAPEAPLQRVLVGGTGSGKKAVAAELSLRHGLQLLSMDSMKVYRGMDVGTDKPSPELQARAPFALLDLVGHEERFSAGDWVRAAQAVADRARRPLLFAGGTPLYLRLMLRGLCPVPPADARLRAELAAAWEQQGEPAVRARLRQRDPRTEARLQPRDRKRLLRALEVAELTGRPLSEWQAEHSRPPLPGRFLVCALRHEPAAHGRRIESRVQRMLQAGLLDEVAALAARAPFAPEPARAIGYAESLAVLAGTLEAAALPARIVTRTRQLVRKQRLHVQSFPEVRWVDVAEGEALPAVMERVEQALELGRSAVSGL
jgi:tRNA dimethylallyltransferase